MARAGNIVGGKYRLVEAIGEGSMGSVWKAVHETLDRPFAVKFLKDYENNTARLHERFLAEARLSASVRHRSVVDVVDYGTTDEGTPYMVMEYLEGESLADRLNHAPALPVRELLRLVHQALSGLAAVHAAGILHRDLKPENIVLCPEGGRVLAKLVDFGISRPLAAQTASYGKTERLTSPGTTLGTPWYMAPEQAQALPIDHRVDLYAMGVILYEALAGRLPFAAEDVQVVLMLVAAGGAAPLSTHRPDLPRALSDLVARALATSPTDRFGSASEMLAVLREVARDVPASAVCRARGAPEAAAPEPLPVAAASEPHLLSLPAGAPASSPTLPLALARLGFVRMPPRGVLIGAGALALAGVLGVVAMLRLEAPAVAHSPPPPVAPDRAPVAALTPRPPPPPPTSVSMTSTLPVAPLPVAPAAPVEPRPKPRKPPATATASNPPDIFRDPGF